MMIVVKDTKDLDKALKEEDANTIMENVTKIKWLVKNQNVFLQKDGKQEVAFIAKRDTNMGGKIVAVPLMPYCKGTKTTGPEMSDKKIGDFARAGGVIILVTN